MGEAGFGPPRKGAVMEHKAILPFVLAAALMFVPGCSEKAEYTEKVAMHKYGDADKAYPSAPSEEPAKDRQLFVEERKIIKEGEVHFESPGLAKTRARVDAAVAKFGGYVSREQEYAYPDRVEQSLVARVPAEKFDDFLAEISAGVKRFEVKCIESTDVTEEFMDAEIRLKIKKETEDRYRQLLSKAKTVKDIVEIEKQMAEIREEIESVEGRLKYLQNRISFSTLTITYYERKSSPVGFPSKFKNGLVNGWRNFVWSLVGLVNVWPFIVLLAIAVAGTMKYRKLRKSRKGGPVEQAGDD